MVASPAILPGVHGGPDALGVPAHDFSTNSNACGPCPAALSALQQADATRYPDPAYTALRAALAALHGVAPDRIVVAGSASEFIHRITTWARLHGCTQVLLPPHSYGDYAQAAQAHGLAVLRRSAKAAVGGEGVGRSATLQWACEPASPLGTVDGVLSAWHGPTPPASVRVLDCAYRPLRLATSHSDPELPASAWQLWSPNKSLGLTGVRAAYAVAPAGAEGTVLALQGLAASWPTSGRSPRRPSSTRTRERPRVSPCAACPARSRTSPWSPDSRVEPALPRWTIPRCPSTTARSPSSPEPDR